MPFTRTVPIRFSHCDPAGIVYFPHYFDMFNGLIEDWYTEQLGVNYAKLFWVIGTAFRSFTSKQISYYRAEWESSWILRCSSNVSGVLR